MRGFRIVAHTGSHENARKDTVGEQVEMRISDIETEDPIVNEEERRAIIGRPRQIWTDTIRVESRRR